MPSNLDKNATDLIDKLLSMNPTERLGYNDINELKSHSFFEGIDFGKLAMGQLDDPGFDNSNQITLMSEDDNSTNFRIDKLFKGDGSTSNTTMSEGNGSPVIMSGTVRKRNKIFFFKKRSMFVLENGMIIIKRSNGQVEETL